MGREWKEKLEEGVRLIAEAINHTPSLHRDLQDAFSALHPALLNRITLAALNAVAERSEYDGRFSPIIREAARLLRKA
ncbi:hypothetical protein [Desulfovirgula thermocuniculi]|uniref:hypothetical protein n=1 Tax=Desulfovirgula thermocuniculi TaxID=348842 RepID=UPI00040CC45C|nr:hypothetical protein [Desulfovirgula thermocuniculi]